jgi:hypothetical protein
VNITDKEATITRKDNTLLVAPRQDGLYVFQATYPGKPKQVGKAVTLVTKAPETPELWHARFGHLGYKNLAELPTMVNGIKLTKEDFEKKQNMVCEACEYGKQQRLPFPNSTSTTTKPLQLLHTDVCGPMQEHSMGGNVYFTTILDDYSGYAVVATHRYKSDAEGIIKRTINTLETSTGHKVITIRSDRGGEFLNKALREFYREKGIQQQTTAPYSPEQNGKAERLNKVLIERTRAILHGRKLPINLWAEALQTATYIRNRSPYKKNNVTPQELMTGKRPTVSHMRVFGSVAYVHVPKGLRTKLDPVSEKGIFVGYDPMSKAYRFLVDGRIKISKSATFDEKITSTVTDKTDLDTLTHSDSGASEDSDTSVHPAAGEGARHPAQARDMSPARDEPEGARSPEPEWHSPEPEGAHGDQEPEGAHAVPAAPPAAPDPIIGRKVSVAFPNRTKRYTGKVVSRDTEEGSGRLMYHVQYDDGQEDDRYLEEMRLLPIPKEPTRQSQRLRHAANMLTMKRPEEEPRTIEEALSGPDADHWRQAMDEEYRSLIENGTWEIVDSNPGIKPIPVKWVYKIKRDSSGRIERYKARLVVKGFMQQQGVDFDEVFAPVSKHTTLRTLLSIVAHEDLEMHQLDIKTAFLNGELEEQVYMKQPPGYEEGGPNKVCHLKKTLYGLRQAPRAWHLRLTEELNKLGAHVSDADPGLYIYKTQNETVYLLVWVDDILLASSSMNAINAVKKALMKTFDSRDLGEAKFFVGLSIERKRTNRSIKLAQKLAITDLVHKFGLKDAKTRGVPMSVATKLTKTEDNPLDTAKYPYSELVGSLMYLAVCTRPDIAQATGSLARYMANPSVIHWTAALGVLRYLAATQDHGILYEPSYDSDKIKGYADADYAGDIDTRRSTTGYVFILNGGAISWSSRLQPTVAVSTAEAEYMAAAFAVKEALWLRKLLMDLGKGSEPIRIYGDNQSALKLIKHPIASLRSKHIDIVYHFTRERAARGEVKFEYIQTDDMVADIMTKPLPENKIEKFRNAMGVKA